MNSCGSVLDEAATLGDCKLENGDTLLFQIRQVQVCGTCHAFAAILGNGSVVTWGSADYGGDSSAAGFCLYEPLKYVESITRKPFFIDPCYGS